MAWSAETGAAYLIVITKPITAATARAAINRVVHPNIYKVVHISYIFWVYIAAKAILNIAIDS